MLAGKVQVGENGEGRKRGRRTGECTDLDGTNLVAKKARREAQRCSTGIGTGPQRMVLPQ